MFNATNTSTNTTGQQIQRSFPEPFGSLVFRMTLIVCTLLIAFLGNLVVIRAVYRVPGRRPLAYLLILNLAVGELLNVVFLPFLFYYEQTLDWIFGEFLCKIINPLQIMCLTNVTVTLAAIAVYRWRVFTVPYKRTVSPLKTKLMIGSFWLVGVTLAVPLLWLRDLTPRGDGRMRCSWKTYDYRGPYAIVHNIVCYVIPFVVMATAYTMVGLRLRRHIVVTKRRETIDRNNSLPTSQIEINMLTVNANGKQSPFPTPPFDRRHRESTQLARAYAENKGIVEMEHDLIRMMYIIVFSFIVCYIPYQLFFILHHVGIWKKPVPIFVAAGYFQWLIVLPSALHPLIYGTKSKFFAKAFSSLFFCK